VQPRPDFDLTPRELEVLYGLARGDRYSEIGAALFISPETVRTHATRLRRKLRARSSAHAIANAFAAGLLQVQEDVRLALEEAREHEAARQAALLRAAGLFEA